MVDTIVIDREAMGKRFKEALNVLRVNDTEFVNLKNISPVRMNQYSNSKTLPKTDYVLLLIELFPQINWYYVILGSKYGSITSPMPFQKLNESESLDELLVKEIEQLKKIIKLQEEGLRDKQKLIDTLSK